MGILGILGSANITVRDFGGIAASGNASSHASRYRKLAIVASRAFSAKQLPTYLRRLGYADDTSIPTKQLHPYLGTRYAAAKSSC